MDQNPRDLNRRRILKGIASTGMAIMASSTPVSAQGRGPVNQGKNRPNKSIDFNPPGAKKMREDYLNNPSKLRNKASKNLKKVIKELHKEEFLETDKFGDLPVDRVVDKTHLSYRDNEEGIAVDILKINDTLTPFITVATETDTDRIVLYSIPGRGKNYAHVSSLTTTRQIMIEPDKGLKISKNSPRWAGSGGT